MYWIALRKVECISKIHNIQENVSSAGVGRDGLGNICVRIENIHYLIPVIDSYRCCQSSIGFKSWHVVLIDVPHAKNDPLISDTSHISLKQVLCFHASFLLNQRML